MLTEGTIRPVASIVVPAYKSANTIIQCIESLVLQETEVPFEVIVVESSSDGAADLVRENFPQVKVVQSPSRLFSGAARNLGASCSSGSLLLFIDSDCVAEPTWVERMWQTHREFDGAGVCGAVLNGNAEHLVSVASYITEFNVFFPHGSSRLMDYLVSCNLSYKAPVFRRYGGFDPNQRLYVDLMFNKKLSAAGEKLLFCPNIQVRHWHRSNTSEYLLHEMRRGQAAVVARRLGHIIGKSWVTYPLLAAILLPILFAEKSLVFPYRYMRTFPREMKSLICALPYVWLGLTFWHIGFMKETLFPEFSPDIRKGSVGCGQS